MRFLTPLLAVAALFLAPLAAEAAPVPYYNTAIDSVQNALNQTIQSINTNIAPAGAGVASSAVQINATASSVNGIAITPGATGTAASITGAMATADANVGLSIAGNGTGIVRLGQTICTITGATPQTCNGQRGIVTTGSLSTAAATDATPYVINNSSVTAASLVVCTVQSYAGTYSTNGNPVIESCVPGSGTITVNLRNVNAANALSGAVGMGFIVLN